MDGHRGVGVSPSRECRLRTARPTVRATVSAPLLVLKPINFMDQQVAAIPIESTKHDLRISLMPKRNSGYSLDEVPIPTSTLSRSTADGIAGPGARPLGQTLVPLGDTKGRTNIDEAVNQFRRRGRNRRPPSASRAGQAESEWRRSAASPCE